MCLSGNLYYYMFEILYLYQTFTNCVLGRSVVNYIYVRLVFSAYVRMFIRAACKRDPNRNFYLIFIFLSVNAEPVRTKGQVNMLKDKLCYCGICHIF